jgi:hypothetical protein
MSPARLGCLTTYLEGAILNHKYLSSFHRAMNHPTITHLAHVGFQGPGVVDERLLYPPYDMNPTEAGKHKRLDR